MDYKRFNTIRKINLFNEMKGFPKFGNEKLLLLEKHIVENIHGLKLYKAYRNGTPYSGLNIFYGKSDKEIYIEITDSGIYLWGNIWEMVIEILQCSKTDAKLILKDPIKKLSSNFYKNTYLDFLDRPQVDLDTLENFKFEKVNTCCLN